MRDVLASYVAEGYNGAAESSKLDYVENLHEHIFCVVAPYASTDRSALLVVMARITDGQVIIDEDQTSVLLNRQLVEAGIPGGHIKMASNLKRSPLS